LASQRNVIESELGFQTVNDGIRDEGLLREPPVAVVARGPLEARARNIDVPNSQSIRPKLHHLLLQGEVGFEFGGVAIVLLRRLAAEKENCLASRFEAFCDEVSDAFCTKLGRHKNAVTDDLALCFRLALLDETRRYFPGENVSSSTTLTAIAAANARTATAVTHKLRFVSEVIGSSSLGSAGDAVRNCRSFDLLGAVL
jgi:hypothetical protein